MFYPPTLADALPRPITEHSACSDYEWEAEDPHCHNCSQDSFALIDRNGCCRFQLYGCLWVEYVGLYYCIRAVVL